MIFIKQYCNEDSTWTEDKVNLAVKATLESQMSVCLSVIKTHQSHHSYQRNCPCAHWPLRSSTIVLIGYHAHLPLCSSAVMLFDHHAHRPSWLSAIWSLTEGKDGSPDKNISESFSSQHCSRVKMEKRNKSSHTVKLPLSLEAWWCKLVIFL